ncbi:MAG: hypothetical protein H7296_10115 [Bacteroidia bacterium]|nr:hypothetical protein [Bacteroidia bacterium]
MALPERRTWLSRIEEADTFNLSMIAFNEDREIRSTLTVTKITNRIAWSNDGKKLAFTINIPPSKKIKLQPNWWGCKTPLKSRKGIMLMVFSKVELVAIP